MSNRLLYGIGLLALAISAYHSITHWYTTSQIAQFTVNNTFRVSPVGKKHGGTGFILHLGNGFVTGITNEHVCDNSALIEVETRDQGNLIMPVIKTDFGSDLCMFGMPQRRTTPEMGISVARTVAPFTPAITSGFALLETENVQHGYVTKIKDVLIHSPPRNGKTCQDGTKPETMFDGFSLMVLCEDAFTVQQTTFTIFPGNSGSPVVNEQGQLIGVISGTHRITKYGHMVPLDQVQRFLQEFVDALNGTTEESQ